MSSLKGNGSFVGDQRIIFPRKKGEKHSAKVIAVIGILVIVLLSSLAIWLGSSNVKENTMKISGGGVRYTTHDVIRINNDTDLSNAASSGSGTQADPYIISGWDIDANGAGAAIYIGNTTKYFVVENCYLHNASFHSWPYFGGTGITLYNVKNGKISKNNITDNWDGIALYSSTSNTIRGNNITNNYRGTYLDSSSSNTISGNNITNDIRYGMVAYWNFNEGSGGTAHDVSGNGNDGTIHGATWVKGVSGDALSFDGNKEYVDCGSDAILNVSYLTITAWVKIDQSPSTHYAIVDKLNYPSNGYILKLEPPSTGGANITYYTSNGTEHWVVYENAQIIGKWAFIAATYDGEEQAIWLNGEKVSSISWSGKINASTNSLCIGGEHESDSFNGIIDEVRVYDRALSANEIRALYHGNITNGIEMENSNHNLIANNSINDNNGDGIYLNSSNSNTISNNSITNNIDYGIHIDSGSYNLIYNNSFYYNYGSEDKYESSHVQAYDNGTNNYWNSSSGIGNYWHDWANNNDTNDQNNDGIVDWPYKIDGSAGSEDHYPLKNATYLIPPLAPRNLQAVAGNGYVNLTWMRPRGNGSSPITEYRIYRNGTFLASVPANQLYYNDTSVVNGYTYTYYITANNSVGESEPSNQVEATPQGAVPEFSTGMWLFIVALVSLLGVIRFRKFS